MVGFPHSEIPGSKLIRSSPRLIAAYYVLHRLHTPRHPLDALKTLDRSHYQCPQLQQPNRALVFAVRSPSSGRSVIRRITASVLIGQIKKNHSSRTSTVPPRGCRVKQTALCLFTMSKDPVADTSQCQHNQTCSLFLRRIDRFGDHQGQPRRLGGARRDRTDDILLAKQALSQLSYGPIFLILIPPALSDERSEDPGNRLPPVGGSGFVIAAALAAS